MGGKLPSPSPWLELFHAHTINACLYWHGTAQVIGSESTYGHNARKDISGSRELFLWLAVKHADQKALEVFSREIAAAGTGMGEPQIERT